jgi:hypothetical protein
MAVPLIGINAGQLDHATVSGQAGSGRRHRQATGSRAIPTSWRAMAQTPQALKAEGRQLRQPNR